jgi:hypothetical protein
MKADAKYLPRFKRVRQHQQLSLSICCTSNGGMGQPGIADLTSIRVLTTVPLVTRRPHPTLQVPETCRPENHAIVSAHDRKRHRSIRVSPAQRQVNVSGGLSIALRNGTPLVERRIACSSSSGQAVSTSLGERFETNVFTRQYEVLYFVPPLSKYDNRITTNSDFKSCFILLSASGYAPVTKN